MKRLVFMLVAATVLFCGCVSTKNNDTEFVGVEKQEMPDQYQGVEDQAVAEPAPTTSTEPGDPIPEAPVEEPAIPPVVEPPADGSESPPIIEISGDDASGDIVVVIDDTAEGVAVVEAGSPTDAVTVPETQLVNLRSRDADRLGIVFRDTYLLQGSDAVSALAGQFETSQIVVYLTEAARNQIPQVLEKIRNWKSEASFYLLVSQSGQLYEYRDQIKKTPNIKGVIYWYEYWNYLTYGFKTRKDAFDSYKRELQIISSVASQNALLCYAVIDWFTAEELTAILQFPLQGIMLATADKYLRIAEYIETDMQIIRSLKTNVSWGIFLQIRPPDLNNLDKDNEIINLLKLYKDDPRFQGIIFMY